MWSRLRFRRPASDRGTSSLELAFAAPALLMMTLLLVQTAMWFHARQVSQAAVEQGAREARAYQGTEAKGTDATQRFFAKLEGDRVTTGGASIDVHYAGDNAVVTLSTHAVKIAPLWPSWPVNVKAGGPIEKFVPPGAP